MKLNIEYNKNLRIFYIKLTVVTNNAELEHREVFPKQKHLVHPSELSGCKLKVPSLQTSQANP